MRIIKPKRRTLLAAAIAVGAAVLSIVVIAPANAVVGGSNASTRDFPWVVTLKLTGVPFSFCGGVLLSPTKVLTAGHCVDGFLGHPSLLHVVAGRDRILSRQGTDVAVSGIWRDPGFGTFQFDGETGYRNDIAVLTLGGRLTSGQLPIATPTQTGLYRPGAPARILGWGTTNENKVDGGVLRTAVVPVVADDSCATAGSYGSVYDASQYTCAGDFAAGGVDTCQFDSGTPLVVDGVVAGITSWGVGCGRAGFPGLYTRVSTFSAAITAQLGG